MKNEKVKAVVKGLSEGLVYIVLAYFVLICFNEEMMELLEYSKSNPVEIMLIFSPIIIIIAVMYELGITFVKKRKK